MARSGRSNRLLSVLATQVLAVVALVSSLLAVGLDQASASSLAGPASGGRSFYRYMVPAELEAVRQTGFLRGGRPGDTFWTDESFTSAAEAQNRLALPSPPELRVRFVIVNTPTLIRDGSMVDPAFGGEGGGREWASPDPVQVEILDVQPLSP
ncbi:MAG TPA: hypothetical protein VFH48_07785 [Chloroflexota bacterium]|nr:hypothetical protein [Chloroflexota bacterium]